MPTITIHHPDGEQSSFELSKVLTSIGRGPDNDIVLPDGSSSGNHAILKKTATGDFSVTDLGSTNHTRVNDRKVQALDLLDGDVILFGDTRVVYSSEISPGKGGSNRPAVSSAPPPPTHSKISAPPSFSAEEKRAHGADKPAKKYQKKDAHPDDGAGAGGCFALLMLPLLLVLCLFAGMEARHYFSTDKKLLHEELLELYNARRAADAAAEAAIPDKEI
ncbi:MAG: FHA domain-containing protein [Verrucomicrobia bacterium]|nr:FHA domain-containing protein [Verrucomicrobiota bacterium]